MEYVARIDLEEVRPVVEDTGRVVVVDFVVQDALTMPARILIYLFIYLFICGFPKGWMVDE